MPSENEQNRARQVTATQISKLEDLWKDNPQGDFDDLDKKAEEEGNFKDLMIIFFKKSWIGSRNSDNLFLKYFNWWADHEISTPVWMFSGI